MVVDILVHMCCCQWHATVWSHAVVTRHYPQIRSWQTMMWFAEGLVLCAACTVF
jgi:hypothetical protein